MKRHFFYNILLNVGLILMMFILIAAYNSEALPVEKYLIIGGAIVTIIVLGYLKYRLLLQVKKLTKGG